MLGAGFRIVGTSCCVRFGVFSGASSLEFKVFLIDYQGVVKYSVPRFLIHQKVLSTRRFVARVPVSGTGSDLSESTSAQRSQPHSMQPQPSAADERRTVRRTAVRHYLHHSPHSSLPRSVAPSLPPVLQMRLRMRSTSNNSDRASTPAAPPTWAQRRRRSAMRVSTK